MATIGPCNSQCLLMSSACLLLREGHGLYPRGLPQGRRDWHCERNIHGRRVRPGSLARTSVRRPNQPGTQSPLWKDSHPNNTHAVCRELNHIGIFPFISVNVLRHTWSQEASAERAGGHRSNTVYSPSRWDPRKRVLHWHQFRLDDWHR